MLITHKGESLMDTIRAVLGSNPEIGILGTVIAFLAPYIEALTPVCQFFAVIFGLIISYYTAKIQIRKWSNLKNQRGELDDL